MFSKEKPSEKEDIDDLPMIIKLGFLTSDTDAQAATDFRVVDVSPDDVTSCYLLLSTH